MNKEEVERVKSFKFMDLTDVEGSVLGHKHHLSCGKGTAASPLFFLCFFFEEVENFPGNS